MTLKPNVQKIILRTSTTQHIERLRCVTGILPVGVRVAFEQRAATPVSCTELLEAPIDDEPSLIRPVRPNFWIPIIHVLSYVIPFFLLWVAYLSTQFIAGYVELIQNSPLYGARIGRLAGPQNAILVTCFLFSFMVAPMLAGALWSSFLTTKIRMNVKLKLVAWFVPILAFCYIDFYIVAALIKFPRF